MARKSNSKLTVTSHVGRDLLASAAVFKTEAAAVWEYVVNALQYVDKGISPVINIIVNARQRKITIADNGRGMSADDLRHYFTMHGENRERRAGRPGRGKFGTGKAAAFGIGRRLRIETVRNRIANQVELSRDRIDRSDGSEIPLDWLVQDEEHESNNGTVVIISEVILDRIEVRPIIEYIERHLAVFRSNSPKVVVNDHICEYREPRIYQTYVFKPSAIQIDVIGNIELVVNVSQSPLPDSELGIKITAGSGNLVAVEAAGVDKKEYGNYLFGEVDCLALEMNASPIEAYDMTRSLQLNPKHPVVAVLIGFIGSKMEEVRSQVAAEHKKARQSEQARRLAAESDRIAEVLNADFQDQARRLADIRIGATPQRAVTKLFGEVVSSSITEDEWVEGQDETGRLDDTKTAGTKGKGGKNRDFQGTERTGRRDPEGSESVSPAGGHGDGRRRPKGGFRVDFRNLGEDADRSQYDNKTLTILINLDHPVVTAAIAGGAVEDPIFRRLAYEIAFSEYAMALGYETARLDPEVPADDLLYDVRATLNRIARAAVVLYRG